MSWSRQVYILYRDFYRDLFRLFSGLKLWSRNPQKSADFGWPDKPRIRTMAVFGTAMRRFESCRPSQPDSTLFIAIFNQRSVPIALKSL